MAIQINVPTLPESVADATVAEWLVQPGDWADAGTTLLTLETDKVMLEVPASHAGQVGEHLVSEGDQVVSDQPLVTLDETAQPPEAPSQEAPAKATSAPSQPEPAQAQVPAADTSEAGEAPLPLGPSARRHLMETGQSQEAWLASYVTDHGPIADRHQERVPMSRLRARVAERLVQAQQTAAMLTTFNEVNMQAIMDLRAQHKAAFEEAHGVRLGLMSFFVKAAVKALQTFPVVNAFIDGKDIVYNKPCDISIAVSSPHGLVVPVLRNAERMGMAEIESEIRNLAKKARDAKLTLEDMEGGTFTITNGGVFGSMLSTPILNPPQSAILGMHNIVKRPVAEGDNVVIRPMMYIALSYDHRLIDGADSVRFLVTLKTLLEDPTRLLLDLP